MKFNIYPKQLQMMRNKVIKEKTLRNLTGGDAGAAKKEEEKEEREPLIFDENEAIHYDPDKFMVLLNQMERQTAAYVLTAMWSNYNIISNFMFLIYKTLDFIFSIYKLIIIIHVFHL